MRCLIFLALVAFCQSSSPYSLGGYSGSSSIWRYLLNKDAGLRYPDQQLYGRDYPYEYGLGKKYYSPLISRAKYGVSRIFDVLGGRYQGLYNRGYEVGERSYSPLITRYFYQRYPYGASRIGDVLGERYEEVDNQDYKYGIGERSYSPLVRRDFYQRYPYGVPRIGDVLGEGERFQGFYNQEYPYQYRVGERGPYGPAISRYIVQQYPYGIWDVLGGRYQGIYNREYQQYPYSQSYGQRFPSRYPLNDCLRSFEGQYQKFPYYVTGESSYYNNRRYEPQEEYVY